MMENSEVLLNQPVEELTNRLLFIESEEQEIPENALFAMSSLKGNSLVLPNTDGAESVLNLELLFNATLAHPKEIVEMFNTEKK
jgi:ABC-2 type transport system ATP-binding protein